MVSVDQGGRKQCFLLKPTFSKDLKHLQEYMTTQRSLQGNGKAERLLRTLNIWPRINRIVL